MIKLKKLLDREFIVLNLSDPQLTNAEWSEGHAHRRILETTVKELIERCSPDLITVSGDFAWAGHDHSYDAFAVFLDSFGIPWAPVWGNHDNQNGTDYIDENAVRFMSFPNCIYENGDLSLGRGNYVILIEEDDRPIEALFMLDSHDRMPFTDENGEEKNAWGKLTVEQINWYLDETKRLKQMGCKDSTIIRHIPIYGYKTAADAAFKQSLSRRDISLEQATTDVCWNEGYTDSEGG